VTVGLVAGDGGCLFWPQSVGMQLAKRHLLSGEPLSGERAHAIGLVSDLVDDPESVLPRAEELAAQLAGLPPLAVQGTKRSLNAVMRARLAEVLELSLEYENVSIQSDDVMEAVAATREKRRPVYQGR
jgi:enoyl-CoA hydratase